MITELNAISNDALSARTEPPAGELVCSMQGSHTIYVRQPTVVSFSAVLLPFGSAFDTLSCIVVCICNPSGVRMTRLPFAAICGCSSLQAARVFSADAAASDPPYLIRLG
jgi:hypothetical protein